MKSTRRDDRHYMSSVRVGPKGQIVIPKEAREMFGIEPGDMLVLLADKKRGIALQTPEKLHPMLRQVFDACRRTGRTRNERIGSKGSAQDLPCFYPEGHVLRRAAGRGGGFYRPQRRGQIHHVEIHSGTGTP